MQRYRNFLKLQNNSVSVDHLPRFSLIFVEDTHLNDWTFHAFAGFACQMFYDLMIHVDTLVKMQPNTARAVLKNA
jgi:hypothetical protein